MFMYNSYDYSECTGGAAVDIIFGVYAELGYKFNSNTEEITMENWFLKSIVPNFNNDISRIGFISFEDDIVNSGPLGYYDDLSLNTTIQDLRWSSGWLRYDLLFDEAISQFDAISSKNSQQILVVMTDDNPRIGSTDLRPVCQYITAFEERGTKYMICHFSPIC